MSERRRGDFLVEMARLAVVVLLVATGYVLGPPVADRFDAVDVDRARLVGALLGALVGYLLGGLGGRQLSRGVDRAQAQLRSVDAGVLVAATLGGVLAALAALVLTSPLLLLPGSRVVTVPIIVLVVLSAAYVGGRLGLSRGGDLARFVGARGGFEVSSPSRGGGTKVVDSSALVDGRIVAIARAGFLEGTLVIPTFVLGELQGLADASDRGRRTAGRRGLDVVRVLQQEHLVVVEVTEDDAPSVTEVDGKLAAIARERRAALVTTDSGLRRVAEISGLQVLDVSVLADAVKPPAAPGDRLDIAITKQGREDRQGVGYLADGSMVVVERAADLVGATVEVEVTSVSQSSRGRMLFAVPAAERVDGG